MSAWVRERALPHSRGQRAPVVRARGVGWRGGARVGGVARGPGLAVVHAVVGEVAQACARACVRAVMHGAACSGGWRVGGTRAAAAAGGGQHCAARSSLPLLPEHCPCSAQAEMGQRQPGAATAAAGRTCRPPKGLQDIAAAHIAAGSRPVMLGQAARGSAVKHTGPPLRGNPCLPASPAPRQRHARQRQGHHQREGARAPHPPAARWGPAQAEPRQKRSYGPGVASASVPGGCSPACGPLRVGFAARARVIARAEHRRPL